MYVRAVRLPCGRAGWGPRDDPCRALRAGDKNTTRVIDDDGVGARPHVTVVSPEDQQSSGHS